MQQQVEKLIKELQAKSDSLWLKVQEKPVEPYDFGYMTALDYAISRLKQTCEEKSE